MLISQITGGLGNQMFQYAMGRALALARGVPWALDISDYSRHKQHQGFELTRVFSCRVKFADASDLTAMLGWQASAAMRRLFGYRMMRLWRRPEFVKEPKLGYCEEIMKINLPAYLVGYWQSEKYFSDYADVIRSDFGFKLPLTKQNARVIAHINNVNAVSVHIRRGDYISSGKANKYHGECSLDYYKNTMKYIADSVENPVFFIFSDEIEWVKVNLTEDYPLIYVTHNLGSESYNDMRLMSRCQHHIIANSSFSWWAAWLHDSPSKIVLAPKRWLAAPGAMTDVLPPDWISL